jgi:phosphohistidine phosphatase
MIYYPSLSLQSLAGYVIYMKTLLLMRHAKSSWKDSKLSDVERPLNKRGKRDAPVMGQLLIDRELIPQQILSSTAVRSLQTAEAVLETITGSTDLAPKVEYLDVLYMAEPPEYYKALHSLPDEVERVMVIGHNPGLETLLQLLSNRIESLPTAVLAHLVLPIQTWSELTPDTTGELVDIWRPKEVREEIEEEIKEKSKEKAKSKGKSKEKSKEKKKK